MKLYDAAQLTDPYDPIYDGCSSATNSSKACFGMPQVIVIMVTSIVIGIFLAFVIAITIILRVARRHGSVRWWPRMLRTS